LFETFGLFEAMREVAVHPDDRKDFNKHLVVGFKKVSPKLQFSAVALFVVGLMFVLFGTTSTRATSINMMFGVLMALLAVTFVVPFVYNLSIDKVKNNRLLIKREKSKDSETKTTKTTIQEKSENKEESIKNSESLNNKEETSTSEQADETLEQKQTVDENKVVEGEVEVVDGEVEAKVVENQVVDNNQELATKTEETAETNSEDKTE